VPEDLSKPGSDVVHHHSPGRTFWRALMRCESRRGFGRS
jgi:hypothetical protein